MKGIEEEKGDCFPSLLVALPFPSILFPLMHQSIPAAPTPPPPPGYCGAFARPVRPVGGLFANFVLPGGRAFANPGAFPKLLTRTRFPIRGFYWTIKHIGSSIKDRKKLKIYACISSLLIKPELHSEIGSYRRESKFFS